LAWQSGSTERTVIRAHAPRRGYTLDMGGFTTASLIASFVVSSIGFVLLAYGRKLARPPQLVVGLVLLVYPYFVPALVPMVVIAAGLLAALWVALQRGH
jgi:hypothetical protein